MNLKWNISGYWSNKKFKVKMRGIRRGMKFRLYFGGDSSEFTYLFTMKTSVIFVDLSVVRKFQGH